MRVSPYRSREDRLLFSGIRAQNLHPSLVGDPADMAGTCGFRIPSLLYLEGADVLLAATDRSHEGADWGYTGVALRRSADRGLTWSSPLSIPVLPPVSRAPQAVDDWHSAFYIDPVLLEDRSGAVHLLLDFFPESKGFHRPDWLEPGSGFEHGRIRLYDGPPAPFIRWTKRAGSSPLAACAPDIICRPCTAGRFSFRPWAICITRWGSRTGWTPRRLFFRPSRERAGTSTWAISF